jgi:hypothetical protein
MKRIGVALLLSVAVGALLAPSIVTAQRKPTSKELAQIASVVHLPAICAKVRVSTESRKPKWAKVSWRRGGSQCEPLASNGVSVVKKSRGRWLFITAGSSFTCGELYAKVPKNVARDLKISCT